MTPQASVSACLHLYSLPEAMEEGPKISFSRAHLCSPVAGPSDTR